MSDSCSYSTVKNAIFTGTLGNLNFDRIFKDLNVTDLKSNNFTEVLVNITCIKVGVGGRNLPEGEPEL